MSQPKDQSSKAVFRVSEDWLAVIVAFIVILLATLGILGQNGLNIPF